MRRPREVLRDDRHSFLLRAVGDACLASHRLRASHNVARRAQPAPDRGRRRSDHAAAGRGCCRAPARRGSGDASHRPLLRDLVGRQSLARAMPRPSDEVFAPLWGWLSRASSDYRDVIVAKLKNPSGEIVVIAPPGGTKLAQATEPPAAPRTEPEPQRSLNWATIVEGIRYWLAQTNSSYRTEIVKKLARRGAGRDRRCRREHTGHAAGRAIAARHARHDPASRGRAGAPAHDRNGARRRARLPRPLPRPTRLPRPRPSRNARATPPSRRPRTPRPRAGPRRSSASPTPRTASAGPPRKGGLRKRRRSARPQADKAEAERKAEAAKAEAEAEEAEDRAEAKRRAEAEAERKAEAKRRADAAEAKRKAAEAKRAAEKAEAKRRAEAAEAERKAEAKRDADAAEAKRKAAEEKRAADAAEAKRKAEEKKRLAEEAEPSTRLWRMPRGSRKRGPRARPRRGPPRFRLPTRRPSSPSRRRRTTAARPPTSAASRPSRRPLCQRSRSARRGLPSSMARSARRSRAAR